MDPVTAFGLAAGVLQVLDFSLKALAKCREIYKDGSLAQHRQTEELTKSLADTSERLRSSAHLATTASSIESEDVIDLSRKCSDTAEELLYELKRLRKGPDDGIVKAAKASLRASRRRRFLQETEGRLRRYQDILNTSILSKLDAQAVQQGQNVQQLDQHVKNLAKALLEGRNTVKQLLSDQTDSIQGHIDHQFQDQARREAMQKVKRDFKEKLFFPEMFARRDNIPRSHEGTCRWIFQPLEQRSRLDDYQKSDDYQGSDHDQGDDHDQRSGGDLKSNEHLKSDVYQESKIARKRVPPEFNFFEWLKKGEDIYWLNGKPGAGKSTLMKYISTEVPELHRSGQILSDCGTKADFMACSFFFWSLGVLLQKDYVGFVRSLLYQIAEQRDDAIDIMMGRTAPWMQYGRAEYAEEFVPTYTWTIERLDDALGRFLDKKPASIRFYVFLDGLDEFEGDEDPLLHTIRLLAQTPGTRVCVSSRPEQIFRQGFANSPQLKLQDFNYHDIERSSRDQLGAILSQYFPDSAQEIQDLIRHVAQRSWGIFLWADLMNKIMKRAAINGDTMQELRERLDDMPDTIDGLYQDMLSRLDKNYLRDAARYMHMLLLLQEGGLDTGELTLLHFACLEPWTSGHKMSDFATWYQSTEFDLLCRKLETRILARCGGLVEIVEHAFPDDQAIRLFGVDVESRDGGHAECKLARESITRHIRLVGFIHKTAADFIRKYDEFVKDPKWPLEATLTVIRGRTEALALVPPILDKTGLENIDIRINRYFLKKVLTALPLLQATWPFEEDHQSIRNLAFDTTNRILDVADYVYTTLNVPNTTFSAQSNSIEHWNEYRTSSSFFSRLGCAAYHGCRDYVRRSVMPSTCSEGLAEEILHCAINGLVYIGRREMQIMLFQIVLDFAPRSRREFWHRSSPNGDDLAGNDDQPRWLTFIWRSMERVLELLAFRNQAVREHGDEHRARQLSSHFLTTWKDVLEFILTKDIDINYIPKVFWSTQYFHVRTGHLIALQMDETILSTLRNNLTPLDPVFSEHIVKLLEAHGAVDSIQAISIGTAESGPNDRVPLQLHRLTQAQRERFLQIPLEQIFFTDLRSLANYYDVENMPVTEQSSRTAEELLDKVLREIEHPGSILGRENSARTRYLHP